MLQQGLKVNNASDTENNESYSLFSLEKKTQDHLPQMWKQFITPKLNILLDDDL